MMRMTRGFSLWRSVVLCAIATLVLGASAVPAGRPIQLNLRPYDGTMLRMVQVTIGHRTRPFILDTGGGITLIEPDEVHDAGCVPFGRAVGFRANGQEVTWQRCGPVVLHIAGYRRTGEVGVFDLGSLLGKQAPPVGGLVGMDSFQHNAITLDLAHNRLIVETSRSLERRIHGMRRVHVRIVRGAGGDVEAFLEVRARIGTLWMEVDSGNNGPVFLSPHAWRQLGVDIPATGTKTLALDVVGLGPVTVTAAQRKMIYDGQLDPLFLRRLILTIDFPTGRAWARRLSG